MLHNTINEISVASKDLVDPELLGSGHYGFACSYRYVGNHPHLVAMAKSSGCGRIVVKSYSCQVAYNESCNAEASNIQILNNKSSNAFVRHQVIKNENGSNSIAIELLNYAIGKSADAHKFISDRTWLTFGNKRNPMLTQNSIRVTFVEFMNSIVSTQHALNCDGFLHLDTKLNNFMVTTVNDTNGMPRVSLKMIDLGLARCMSASKDGKRLFHYNNMKLLMQYTRFNRETISSFVSEVHDLLEKDATAQIEFSILTELFMRKITIIEMLGTVLGMSSKDMLDLTKFSLTPDQERRAMRSLGVLTNNKTETDTYFYVRAGITDGQALNAFCNNVIAVAEKRQSENPDDPRANVVLELISIMKPYLTAMPETNIDWRAEANADMQLFNEYYKKYTCLIESIGLSNAEYQAIYKNIIDDPKPDLYCDEEFFDADNDESDMSIDDDYSSDLKTEESVSMPTQGIILSYSSQLPNISGSVSSSSSAFF